MRREGVINVARSLLPNHHKVHLETVTSGAIQSNPNCCFSASCVKLQLVLLPIGDLAEDPVFCNYKMCHFMQKKRKRKGQVLFVSAPL